MRESQILKLKLPEDGDQASPVPFNENFQALEKALALLDHLASTYGYTVEITEAEGSTTTTLTVDTSAPVTASRKTVETISDDATTYAVTVTIGDESHTMTHTISATTGSGVDSDE